MSDTTTPNEPAIGDAAAAKKRGWAFWRRRPKPEKRPLLARLFGLSLWGTLKLVFVCVLVGFVMLAMQFDPASPNFDATSAIGEFARNTLATARWAVVNFWKPALTGAGVVLPIWVLWRLVTLPFRR